MLAPSITPVVAPAACGIALWTAVLTLAGCANVDEATSRLFSSNASATALFGSHLLHGRANFTGNREATIRLQGVDVPGLSCFGNLRFSATASGVVAFTCNDGQSVTIPFRSLSPLRGSGRILVGGKVFALTYGFPAEAAAPFLGIATERLLNAQTATPMASSTPSPNLE